MPRLLDLYCGAGGAARGYQLAGFEVLGVDIDHQKHYAGDYFLRADALDVLLGRTPLDPTTFDVIHASPPCQQHSILAYRTERDYPNMVPETRVALNIVGRPWVIENVEGAPLIDPVRLCGASFTGLRVLRHRLFESNIPLGGVPCPEEHPLVFTHDKRKAHYGQLDQNVDYVQVTGSGNATVANKCDAMGIDWRMTGPEVNEAIPPAYTEFIGGHLLAAIS